MIRNIVIVCFILAFVDSISSASAPFIKKCVTTNTKCLKDSSQFAVPIFAKGIKELGIESMDPLKISKLDASSPSLKLILTNMVGVGLKDTIIKKVKFNDDRSKILVKLIATVEFNGHYEVDGRLLILPISGNGKIYLLLNKIQITVEGDLDQIQGKDGEMYWNLKDWRHSYELKEKSTIQLENLFNGNKALGRAAEDLLEGSPNEIINEVGPQVIKTVIDKIVKNIRNFFRHVALKDLTDMPEIN